MKKIKKNKNEIQKFNTISFVIPCLNEEKTLPFVLEKCNHLKNNDLANYNVEILVADNGSTDKSISIAKKYGARIVHCKIKGYGAALDCGIRNAKGEIIVFADADDTYDFLESPSLIKKIEEGNFDLVIGSRLNGKIYKGAMPFLHRYLGTPVINFIINLLYSNKYKILDANSGFRSFKKEAYLKWNVKSTGMEFASEMIIKALLFGSSISHVPISLYPDKPGRKPHLKTWRDGMRHLLRILLYSPNLFLNTGIFFMTTFFTLLLIGYLVNIQKIFGIYIFGLHTLLITSFFVILGHSIWGIGLFLSAKNLNESHNKSTGFIQFLLNLSEDSLFFLLIGLIFSSFFGIIGLFIIWRYYNYQFLNFEREVVLIMTFLITNIQTFIYILVAHIFKRE